MRTLVRLAFAGLLLTLAIAPAAGMSARPASPSVATRLAEGSPDRPPVAAPVATTEAPDVARYAQREKKSSKELAKFEGGSKLVIAGSTTVLLLIVIILILL